MDGRWTHLILCALVVLGAAALALATGSPWALIPIVGCGLMLVVMVALDRESHHG